MVDNSEKLHTILWDIEDISFPNGMTLPREYGAVTINKRTPARISQKALEFLEENYPEQFRVLTEKELKDMEQGIHPYAPKKKKE